MIGQRVSHYQILEKLGEGGMGEVYRARDTKLDREVALKVLPDEIAANEEYRKRFEREVKAIAALNHPNIVTIHSVEEFDDINFYTMELVDGQTLSTLIPSKGLPLERLFAIAIPVTDAVSTAHLQGITHRDLKPTNIMVDKEGRAKVLDFGLAKLRAATGESEAAATVALGEDETAEGRILGTVSYMSPEQAEGKSVDNRSDIFSLGVILYEMATGRRPFHGDTPVSTITSILRDVPQSVTDLRETLPRHLGRIIKKCLEKDPDRRYQTALDLRNDLQGLREEIDSGDLEMPVGISPRPGKPSRRWLGLAAAALIIAALSFGVGQLLKGGGPATREVPTSKEMVQVRLTNDGKATHACISPDGKYVAYVHAEAGLNSLRIRQISTGSETEILPPTEASLGYPEISPDGDHVFFLQWTRDEPGEIHRIPLLGGVSRRVIRDARRHFSLSPHDGRIAFNRVTNDTVIIMAANLDGSEERELTRLPVLTDLPLAWSPNGQVIYSSSWKSRSEPFGVELVEIPVAGGAPRAIASERWTFVHDIFCLPDGSGLVFVGIRGNQRYQDPTGLFLFSLREEDFLHITQDLFEYFYVSCDREGKQLVTVQRSGQQVVLILPADHPERSRQLFFVSHVGGHFTQATWTPEGRVLTEHKAGESLQIISLNPNGKEFHPITYEGSLNMGACISPDGDRVAFFSNRSGTMRIWIADITGSNPRRLSDEECEEFFPQFTPDGQWIVYHAFVDQKWCLRKAPVSGGSSASLIDVPAFYPKVSHDGNWIACHAKDMESGDYRLALVPIDGDSLRFVDAEPGLQLHCWMPDDDGLTCSLREEGVDNIWVVPLDGSAPLQMTHFEKGTIQSVDWNAAGDSLAVVQRERSSDVVLLRNFLP